MTRSNGRANIPRRDLVRDLTVRAECLCIESYCHHIFFESELLLEKCMIFSMLVPSYVFA